MPHRITVGYKGEFQQNINSEKMTGYIVNLHRIQWFIGRWKQVPVRGAALKIPVAECNGPQCRPQSVALTSAKPMETDHIGYTPVRPDIPPSDLTELA